MHLPNCTRSFFKQSKHLSEHLKALSFIFLVQHVTIRLWPQLFGFIFLKISSISTTCQFPNDYENKPSVPWRTPHLTKTEVPRIWVLYNIIFLFSSQDLRWSTWCKKTIANQRTIASRSMSHKGLKALLYLVEFWIILLNIESRISLSIYFSPGDLWNKSPTS